MAKLFPRLSPNDAAVQWESLIGLSISDLKSQSKTSHPGETFAAVGGERITPNELDNIAKEIRGIAKSHGYPGNANRLNYSEFDTNLAIYLGTKLDIPPAEAYRPQTWAFFSLVLLPDIVMWRFPGFNISRCTGGRRDCFHRLWLRATIFDLGKQSDNRWIILKYLTEDSFVSIIERPSLAGNATLCKLLGLAWIKTANTIGRNKMEEINRKAIKRIRAKGTIIFFEALATNEVKNIANKCYLAEAKALTDGQK